MSDHEYRVEQREVLVRDPIVYLGELELILGALVGVFRRVDCIVRGRENRARGIEKDGNQWTRDVEGALAEIAAAKVLDAFWLGAASSAGWREPKPDGGDVARVQVRCRIADPDDLEKRLIVQRRDRDDEAFLLVVGRAPAYRVAGWLPGADAKQPEWLADPGGYGPAWFVPQHALRPIATLPLRRGQG